MTARYIPPETVAELKQIDLLTYLQNCEPHELIRVTANEYCTDTHDSLRISTNGLWNWTSQGIGGRNAFKYLTEVRGHSFLEAANILLDSKIQTPIEPLPKMKKVKLPLELPRKDNNRDTLINYLTGRGIDREIIQYCIDRGVIYQSTMKGHTNAVFIGLDELGVPRSAFRRGTTPGVPFYGDATGSDKRYSFGLRGRNQTTLYVFEAAIDGLSFLTRQKLTGHDFRDFTVLSTNGVHFKEHSLKNAAPPLALKHYLEAHEDVTEIHLHFDNDRAGQLATEIVKAQYGNRYLFKNDPPSCKKDENEYLQYLLRNKGSREAAFER